MTSYRHGQPSGLTLTRHVAGVTLGSREAVAAYAYRHPDTVRRYCKPVACDAATRAMLYDLDGSLSLLSAVKRRLRRVA